MIECTTDFIYKKTKKFNFRFKFKRIVIFVCIIAIVLSYFKFVVYNQIYKICYDSFYAYSLESVNNAILIQTETQNAYDSIITVEKNSDGEITLISTNQVKINKIKGEIVNKSEILLKNKLQKGVPIPLLAFFGLGFLSGYGKQIYYKNLTVSTVSSDFLSVFESVGINQTRHSIYIVVSPEVTYNVALFSKKAKCNAKVLICETVLIGKVPEVYLKGSILN